MTDREVPPVIKLLDVSRACKVSKKKARGWLRAAGILEVQDDGNATLIVQERQLREKRPDIYQRVYAHFVFRDSERPPAN